MISPVTISPVTTAVCSSSQLKLLPSLPHVRWSTRLDFSEVRAFDVCGSRRWFSVGELSTPRFAIQTCASTTHTFTCGGFNGAAPNRNSGGCDVHDRGRLESLANKVFAQAVDDTNWRRLAEGMASGDMVKVISERTKKRSLQGEVLERFGFK